MCLPFNIVVSNYRWRFKSYGESVRLGALAGRIPQCCSTVAAVMDTSHTFDHTHFNATNNRSSTPSIDESSIVKEVKSCTYLYMHASSQTQRSKPSVSKVGS